MRIGGLQKLTLLDYPGKVACTVFLSGCNLRCPYCHNPALVLPEQNNAPRNTGVRGICLSGAAERASWTASASPAESRRSNRSCRSFSKNSADLGYAIKLDTNGTNPRHAAGRFFSDAYS